MHLLSENGFWLYENGDEGGAAGSQFPILSSIGPHDVLGYFRGGFYRLERLDHPLLRFLGFPSRAGQLPQIHESRRV